MPDMQVTSTLGPQSTTSEIMESLLRVSTRFRLNASHLSPDQLNEWLERIAQIAGKRFPVIIDLRGAKARIGQMPEGTQLPSQVRLEDLETSSTLAVIPVPGRGIVADLRGGDRLLLNDGKVELEVLSECSGGSTTVQARVIRNGPLSSHKGINRPGRPLPFLEISERDKQFVDVGNRFSSVQYALSFVASGQDARLMRALAPGRHIVGKVERPEAMNQLIDIDRGFDELWLCRGDLGAEVGWRQLARAQAEFIAHLRDMPSARLKKPASLAGEVLGSMVYQSLPSRSEMVQLYEAEQAGFSGIVLSDETAVGGNVAAVAAFLTDFYSQK